MKRRRPSVHLKCCCLAQHQHSQRAWMHMHMHMHTFLLLISLVSLLPFTTAMASSAYVSAYGEMSTVLDGRVELPCNLTLPSPDDAIHLVFWYKGNSSRVPIYTLDARASPTLWNATHFPSDSFSPNRAIFILDPFKPLGLLRIEPVREEDHSDYRCRVDFRWGRTISSLVSLHVVVPPKHIKIRDQSGNDLDNSTIGPYNQNDNVTLVCESKGGIPPPMLRWFKDNNLIDESYSFGMDGTVWNELVINNLSPSHLNDKYVCQASNYNSSNIKQAFVVLDINLIPSQVRILSNRPRLLVGRKVDIRCETYDSKPNAVIKWYKNGELLPYASESYSGNKTMSAVTLMPTMQDNNVQLACRSYNPRLAHKYIEDLWQLQVLYAPQLLLLIHNKTRSIVVDEDAQVIIECHVSANPVLVDIQIYFNSTRIFHQKRFDSQRENVTRLIIAHVTSKHHGRYQCMASNQEGLSRSNEVYLDVQYAPKCADKHQEEMDGEWANKDTTKSYEPMNNDDNRLSSSSSSLNAQPNKSYHYALALNETIRFTCNVNANPAPRHYYWTLNANEFDEDHIFAQTNAHNELTFTAHTLESFGRLSCWAKNELGLQRKPCINVISKAGPPLGLVGCSVSNKTTTSLTIECFPGDDGGSPQTFHAHLFIDPKASMEPSNDHFLSVGGKQAQRSDSSDILNFTSTSSPMFYFNNLRPGTTYIIELYASNSRGHSELQRLSVPTLFTKNTKLVSSSLQEIEYDPIFSISIVALFTVFFVMMATYITCRLKHRTTTANNPPEHVNAQQIKQNFVFQPSSKTSSSFPANEDENGNNNKMASDSSMIHIEGSIHLDSSFSESTDRTADIFPYDAPKSKLNLYVINEIKDEPLQLRNVLGKPNGSGSMLQLAGGNSLAMLGGGGEATLVPFSATGTNSTTESLLAQSLIDSQMLARQMMEQQQQQQQHPQHVNTTGEPMVASHYYQHSNGTILYTPASLIPSHFVSINPKIGQDGLLVNNEYGVYQSDGLNGGGTFTLMHQSPYNTLTVGRFAAKPESLSSSCSTPPQESRPIPLNCLNVSSLESSKEETSSSQFEYPLSLV